MSSRITSAATFTLPLSSVVVVLCVSLLLIPPSTRRHRFPVSFIETSWPAALLNPPRDPPQSSPLRSTHRRGCPTTWVHAAELPPLADASLQRAVEYLYLTRVKINESSGNGRTATRRGNCSALVPPNPMATTPSSRFVVVVSSIIDRNEPPAPALTPLLIVLSDCYLVGHVLLSFDSVDKLPAASGGGTLHVTVVFQRATSAPRTSLVFQRPTALTSDVFGNVTVVLENCTILVTDDAIDMFTVTGHKYIADWRFEVVDSVVIVAFTAMTTGIGSAFSFRPAGGIVSVVNVSVIFVRSRVEVNCGSAAYIAAVDFGVGLSTALNVHLVAIGSIVNATAGGVGEVAVAMGLITDVRTSAAGITLVVERSSFIAVANSTLTASGTTSVAAVSLSVASVTSTVSQSHINVRNNVTFLAADSTVSADGPCPVVSVGVLCYNGAVSSVCGGVVTSLVSFVAVRSRIFAMSRTTSSSSGGAVLNAASVGTSFLSDATGNMGSLSFSTMSFWDSSIVVQSSRVETVGAVAAACASVVNVAKHGLAATGGSSTAAQPSFQRVLFIAVESSLNALGSQGAASLGIAALGFVALSGPTVSASLELDHVTITVWQSTVTVAATAGGSSAKALAAAGIAGDACDDSGGVTVQLTGMLSMVRLEAAHSTISANGSRSVAALGFVGVARQSNPGATSNVKVGPAFVIRAENSTVTADIVSVGHDTAVALGISLYGMLPSRTATDVALIATANSDIRVTCAMGSGTNCAAASIVSVNTIAAVNGSIAICGSRVTGRAGPGNAVTASPFLVTGGDSSLPESEGTPLRLIDAFITTDSGKSGTCIAARPYASSSPLAMPVSVVGNVSLQCRRVGGWNGNATRLYGGNVELNGTLITSLVAGLVFSGMVPFSSSDGNAVPSVADARVLALSSCGEAASPPPPVTAAAGGFLPPLVRYEWDRAVDLIGGRNPVARWRAPTATKSMGMSPSLSGSASVGTWSVSHSRATVTATKSRSGSGLSATRTNPTTAKSFPSASSSPMTSRTHRTVSRTSSTTANATTTSTNAATTPLPSHTSSAPTASTGANFTSTTTINSSRRTDTTAVMSSTAGSNVTTIPTPAPEVASAAINGPVTPVVWVATANVVALVAPGGVASASLFLAVSLSRQCPELTNPPGRIENPFAWTIGAATIGDAAAAAGGGRPNSNATGLEGRDDDSSSHRVLAAAAQHRGAVVAYLAVFFPIAIVVQCAVWALVRRVMGDRDGEVTAAVSKSRDAVGRAEGNAAPSVVLPPTAKGGWQTSWTELSCSCRFPSSVVIAAQVACVTGVSSGVVAVQQGGPAVGLSAALLAWALGVAVATVAYVAWMTTGRRFRARHAPLPTGRDASVPAWVQRALTGDRMWTAAVNVATQRVSTFHARHRMLYHAQRRGRTWWMSAELAAAIVAVALGSVRSANTAVCGAVAWLIVAVNVVMLALVVALRPFIAPADMAQAVVVGVLSVVAAALMAASLDEAGDVVANLGAAIAVARFALDIAVLALENRRCARESIAATVRAVLGGHAPRFRGARARVAVAVGAADAPMLAAADDSGDDEPGAWLGDEEFPVENLTHLRMEGLLHPSEHPSPHQVASSGELITVGHYSHLTDLSKERVLMSVDDSPAALDDPLNHVDPQPRRPHAQCNRQDIIGSSSSQFGCAATITSSLTAFDASRGSKATAVGPATSAVALREVNPLLGEGHFQAAPAALVSRQMAGTAATRPNIDDLLSGSSEDEMGHEMDADLEAMLKS